VFANKQGFARTQRMIEKAGQHQADPAGLTSTMAIMPIYGVTALAGTGTTTMEQSGKSSK
jgi:hypothetical protein